MRMISKGLRLTRDDRRRVISIMLPAMIELILSQLFTMVDTIMLGQSEISAVAIAAVGLTNNPMNLTRSVLIALNVGTTAGVAWAIGAREDKSAQQIARNALMLCGAIGLLLMTLVYGAAGSS